MLSEKNGIWKINNTEIKLREKTERNKKSWIGNIGLVVLLGCLLNFGAVYAHQTILQQGIAESVLRFHVLANSDSEEDQAVKLEVRDAVLNWINEEMIAQIEADTVELPGEQDEKIASYELANDNKVKIEAFLQENMENIVAVADQVLEECGMPYRASAKIEQCYFPDRTYGECTFPAGWYDALRICLGEAKGHNWWCVLYPRLCFADCLYVVDEPEAAKTETSRITAQDGMVSEANRTTTQDGTESEASGTIAQDGTKLVANGATAQEGMESAENGMVVQAETVSVDENQLKELEAVLTVEEYECLLQSPTEWKIGWRWLKFWE